MERLSIAQARRLALAAQGFARPRPTGRVDRRHLHRVLDQIGLIQIDSVNVLARSQELVLFARLGPHPRGLIDDATRRGELFEYWVHEASHLPTEHHHLHRWQMNGVRRWPRFLALHERRPGFVEEVYDRVAAEGPLASGDLAQRVGRKGSWWDWDDGKVALEHLFWTGRLTATRRSSDFARLYDLTERVIPAHILQRAALPEREARKELLAMAARHHGVATFDDLTDYHRLNRPACRPLISELVEAGGLVPVQVEGWTKQAYVHPDAQVPRRLHRAALLSPFDPVVWQRDRTERLFGFRYRIEIYVPAPRRVYGYYVLPFLLGDRLVARVDLKSDRQGGALLARAAFGEPGAPVNDVAHALAAELTSMATWLGLERVEVGDRGDLASPLAAVVHQYAHS